MSVSAENLAAAVMSAAAAAASSASSDKENTRTLTSSSTTSAASTSKFGLADPYSKVTMYDAEKKQMILMRGGGQEALTGVCL